MDKSQEIAQKLQFSKIEAEEAQEMRLQLAGLYSFYSSQLESILMRRPNAWSEIRKRHKSDMSATREWEATEDGLNELGLGMRLKRIEKMLSALKTITDMKTVDYHHTK